MDSKMDKKLIGLFQEKLKQMMEEQDSDEEQDRDEESDNEYEPSNEEESDTEETDLDDIFATYLTHDDPKTGEQVPVGVMMAELLATQKNIEKKLTSILSMMKEASKMFVMPKSPTK